MGTFTTFALAALLQGAREPVPAAADMERAERSVKAVFEKEYGPKDRPGRRLAARRLLEESAGAKDTAERYVLLRDAARMGAESVDLGTVLHALDLMTAGFDIPAIEAYAAAVGTAKKAPSLSPEEAAAIADLCLSAWEKSTVLDDHDAAAKWANEASDLAKRANDAALRQAADDMGKDSTEARRIKERALAAAEVLARDGADADAGASLGLGLYHAAVRSDWARAIEFLAKGSDAGVADVARRDAAGPKDPETAFKLGEAWAKLAAKERTLLLRRAYECRARQWQEGAYRAATGTARTEIARKLNKDLRIVKATYGPGGKGADVTAAVADAVDRDPWAPIRAGDELVGGYTPAAETLAVEYHWNGRRLTETAREGEVVVLTGASEKGAGFPWTSRAFRVVAAHYGAGAKFVDVKEAAGYVTGPYGVFRGKDFGIDPHPGVVKTAVLQFEWHGRRFCRSVKEGEVVRVAPGPR